MSKLIFKSAKAQKAAQEWARKKIQEELEIDNSKKLIKKNHGKKREYKAMTDAQTNALVEKAGLQEKIATNMLTELEKIYKVLERDLKNVVDRSQQQAKENAESAKQSKQNELIDQFNQTAGLYGVEKRDRSPDEIIDLFRNSGDLDRADKLQVLS